MKTGIVSSQGQMAWVGITVIGATDTSQPALNCSGVGNLFFGCAAIGCAGGGIAGATSSFAFGCIAAGNASQNGTYGFATLGGCYNCDVYSYVGSTCDGFHNIQGACVNCIAEACGRYGFDSTAGTWPTLVNCAGYNNGTSDYNPTNYTFSHVGGFLALTATPFSSPGTTVGSDFSLNQTE